MAHPLILLRSASGRLRRFSRCPANGGYRRCLVIAVRSGQGLLTEPTTGAQVGRRELVFMPHTCRSQYPSGPAQLRGIRTVRRPGALCRINERRRLPLFP